MIFSVFHKTGELYDKENEWDGDTGYNVDFEISNKEIENHIKELIVSQYFNKTKDSYNYQKAYDMLTELLDSMDITRELVNLFKYELQDWAQELYDNQ